MSIGHHYGAAGRRREELEQEVQRYLNKGKRVTVCPPPAEAEPSKRASFSLGYAGYKRGDV